MQKPAIQGSFAHMYDQARTRILLVVMILMMGYLAVGARLVNLTLVRPDKGVEIAGNDEIRPLEKPLRGSILDRNGDLIAASLKMASVYADATLAEKPEELAGQLAAILPEQKRDALLQKLTSGKKFVWIQRNITPKQTYAINALGNPALSFQEEDRRIYPDGNLAAHITGYTDIDGNGIAGAEKFFDKRLSETDKPVRLTIDLRVQHILHREISKAVGYFHAKGGIGMVMDVHTGELLSMVSLPDFDPNHAGDAKDLQKFNRATLGVFEMGSTFKLFSVAAALDSGFVHLGDVFDATDSIHQGRFTISDFHPKHRPLTVPEIFIYSSNVGTAKMAEVLGGEKMQNFYRTLGFMSQASVELPERGMPLFPSPWRDIDTLTTSFGHGIAVSPLHLIRAASALVNGGIMPKSTLIRADEDSVRPLPEEDRVISEKTSRQLRQLLELVVVNGTGNNAYVEGYNVGGKTGTAEKNIRGKYEHDVLLSSFLGMFPIHDPRYAVLVILDEPQPTKETHNSATGGWTAAPVVARVVEQMGPLYQLPPDKKRTPKDIEREMKQYLKEWKEGGIVASLGTDR